MMHHSKLIGNKIATARKKMNLSQSQLAQRLFISPQAVGKWERGESMPDITIFNQLAEIFGVDLNYFSENFKSETHEITSTEIHALNLDKISTQKNNKETSWDMSKMNLSDCDFSGLKNLSDSFSFSNMQNCKFIDAELSGLILKSNNIENCNFSKSKFNESQFNKSNLNKDIYIECELQSTEFIECCVNSCDFSKADLTKSKLQKCFFSDCNMIDANLTAITVKYGGFEKCNFKNIIFNQISFFETYFTNIVFEGIIENGNFENCSFNNVKFKDATLLNSFFKNNKKFKKVIFENCKADKITYAFLKNNQAVLTGVTLLP